MATMSRNQFRKSLQDGLNAIFGMEYDKYPEEWRDIFDQETSNKAFEEDVLYVGLGGAVEKAEGAAITYDEGGEGWVARYDHTTIALGFRITQEAREDNLYGDIGKRFTKAMARSFQFTKEVRAASVLNNAFSSSYTGGDAKALCVTDHPLAGGGSFSNRPTTAADLSEASLEDATIMIAGFVDDRGLPIMARSKKLIVSRYQKFVAHRILNSTGRVGTSNNDTNALRDMSEFQTPSLNHYLTDPYAWYIKTDVDYGLRAFKRKALETGMEGDFETGNLRYKGRERYSFGWTDPRGMYASPGVTP